MDLRFKLGKQERKGADFAVSKEVARDSLKRQTGAAGGAKDFKALVISATTDETYDDTLTTKILLKARTPFTKPLAACQSGSTYFTLAVSSVYEEKEEDEEERYRLALRGVHESLKWSSPYVVTIDTTRELEHEWDTFHYRYYDDSAEDLKKSDVDPFCALQFFESVLHESGKPLARAEKLWQQLDVRGFTFYNLERHASNTRKYLKALEPFRDTIRKMDIRDVYPKPVWHNISRCLSYSEYLDFEALRNSEENGYRHDVVFIDNGDNDPVPNPDMNDDFNPGMPVEDGPELIPEGPAVADSISQHTMAVAVPVEVGPANYPEHEEHEEPEEPEENAYDDGETGNLSPRSRSGSDSESESTGSTSQNPGRGGIIRLL